MYVIYFDTNFESYSQRFSHTFAFLLGCMLSTSIQILKAIHNPGEFLLIARIVVCYLLRYKFWKLFTTTFLIHADLQELYVIYFDTNFESYSQRITNAATNPDCCMLSTSIQILKAIHNINACKFIAIRVVCYLLRYKFWKLFTT